MSDLRIAVDDPHRPDIAGLLARHLEVARRTSPPGFAFALDVEGLVRPDITFCSARRDGALLGVGALREIDATNGELKSMHIAAEARRQGVGRSILDHLLGLARGRRYGRVSLETGSQDEFIPARALYAAAGFAVCGRFGDYPDSTNSVFMTLALT